LFYTSNATYSWSPLRLERPIELYTAQELEYLVVRRESQERKRKTQDKLYPALTRRLPIDNSGNNTLRILINEGRWLLTASGSVSYYDLDTRKPAEKLLIPQIIDQDGSFRVVKMAVDIDDESTLLTFNLALFLEKGDGFFYSPEFQSQ
jgi:hypothetical protein